MVEGKGRPASQGLFWEVQPSISQADSFSVIPGEQYRAAGLSSSSSCETLPPCLGHRHPASLQENLTSRTTAISKSASSQSLLSRQKWNGNIFSDQFCAATAISEPFVTAVIIYFYNADTPHVLKHKVKRASDFTSSDLKTLRNSNKPPTKACTNSEDPSSKIIQHLLVKAFQM